MIFFTTILIFVPLSSGLRFEPYSREDIENATNSSINFAEPSQYIVKLLPTLDDSSISEYFGNVIIGQPSKLNITTGDILKLYRIKNITIAQTENILTKWNVSVDKVFSIEGVEMILNELKLDFKTFYTNVVSELQVNPEDQLTFLDSLSVDAMAFSFALQFGDPYVEFRKGNLSRESFINAVQTVSRSTEQVFGGIRNQFLTEILKKTPEENINILSKYGQNREKIPLVWSVMNVSTEDLQNVPIFNGMVHSLITDINVHSPLGILVGKTQVIANKVTVNLFQRKPIKINATYIIDNKTSTVSRIDNSTIPNIMALSLQTELVTDNISTVALSTSPSDLFDCVLRSLDSNGSLVSEVVPKVQNFGDVLKFSSSIFSTNISMGAPLICSNQIYGMVREINSGVVTLDAFSVEVVPSKPQDDKSSAIVLRWNSLFIFSVFSVINLFLLS